MSHKRSEIRAAFVDLLKSKTSAGIRVYSSRVRPIWKEELPAINVWTDGETGEVFDQGPLRYRRTLQVIIEAHAASTINDGDEAIDSLVRQIEILVDTQEEIFDLPNILFGDLLYEGCDYAIAGEGTRINAVAKLRYSVTYFTVAGVRTETLLGVEGVDADWNLEGTKASDEINLPQA